MPASNIRAGKATLPSTRAMEAAAAGHQCLTATPRAMGTAMSTMFCTSRLPTGRCTAPTASAPLAATAPARMTGTVTSVMTLLNAVSVTDSATSPPASIENTLLELPPGQHAISTNPTKNKGGS